MRLVTTARGCTLYSLLAQPWPGMRCKALCAYVCGNDRNWLQVVFLSVGAHVCCPVPAAAAAGNFVHGDRMHCVLKTANVNGHQKWLTGYGGRQTHQHVEFRTSTGRKNGEKRRTSADGNQDLNVTIRCDHPDPLITDGGVVRCCPLNLHGQIFKSGAFSGWERWPRGRR